MASYDTPDAAIRGFMNRVDYRRNQDLLLETVPSHAEGLTFDRGAAAAIVAKALADGPRMARAAGNVGAVCGLWHSLRHDAGGARRRGSRGHRRGDRETRRDQDSFARYHA